jgi:dTDP-4-dehydrorhamnose reductase
MRAEPAGRESGVSSPLAPPEVWAGVECSVVRVGDSYRDAIRRVGHDQRRGDVARIASLGVRSVRFPLLWERTAPDSLERADWGWADEQLHALREQGIRPIVGLLHHGSGPRGTSLLDPELPTKLAAFAAAVARRYPWVLDFTPINEPLTTARFSALYGLWYPHARSAPELCRALVTQCLAVQRAMEAIREHTPQARLVQTEDYARIGSTPGLAYQAAFENERRWLSLDLLCGFVDEHHVMYPHLRENGVGEDELARLRARPCVPDVIGVNYYVTSERWLDERIHLYPPSRVGGNGRHAYVDVEAVRACPEPIWGHEGALAAVWERYGRPLALTEVHLGCTREEQLRWWDEAWRAAVESRRRGIDVRAVTTWAVFGSHDWDSLLVGDLGTYEPGAFDVRDGAPKPTALARAVAACAREGAFDHPVLDAVGWWRRPARFGLGGPKTTPPASPLTARFVLIQGAPHPLARALEDACARRGIAFRHSAAPLPDGKRPWATIDVAAHASASDTGTLHEGASAILDELVDGWPFAEDAVDAMRRAG